MRFELKRGLRLILKSEDYSSSDDLTKRIGQVIDPEWIKPFMVATSMVEDRLRLLRLHCRGTSWDILTPVLIDSQLVATTALDQGLAWRELVRVLPVTFNMFEAPRELAGDNKRSLPPHLDVLIPIGSYTISLT